MNQGRVGVLLLAAGFSRRFGADKRLHLVNGKPLLQRTVEGIQDSGLPLRVCLRDEDAPVLDVLQPLGIEVLHCRHSQQGMGVSLAQGVAACSNWQGVLIALGDMAWVQASTYAQLAAALEPGGIVQPLMDERRGNPVGFSAQYFEALKSLTGDRGGRDVIEANRHKLRLVGVNDPGILRDLDALPG